MFRTKAINPCQASACALLAIALASTAGCRNRADSRTEDPGVSIGLAGLVDEPQPASLQDPPQPTKSDLESLVAAQAAALEAAYGGTSEAAPATQEPSEAPDVSLHELVQGEPGVSEQEPVSPEAQEPEPPQPEAEDPAARVDELSAQLADALGQKLEATSEPFRTAVAMIALAAAQGRDPHEAIAPGTPAAAKLSPAELKSAEVVAQLLGTLLSPGDVSESDRAEVLGQFAAKLSQHLGLTLPKAVLCTRVRGFGKYEPFTKADFLAGKRIRALVYVEVDGFEHRPMDTTRLGGLETEDQWSVELSEELELRHEGDGMLAWRRSPEKVVETSRNRQRDFYLLADIELPSTLTVGAYQLKVIVRDDVSGSIAETLIPIGVVADPNLAWQGR